MGVGVDEFFKKRVRRLLSKQIVHKVNSYEKEGYLDDETDRKRESFKERECQTGLKIPAIKTNERKAYEEEIKN
jgi:hypothetical protein